jgi:hypothetical protein
MQCCPLTQMAVRDGCRTDAWIAKGQAIFLKEIESVECQLLCRQQAAHALDAPLPHEGDPPPDFFAVNVVKIEARPLGAEHNPFSSTCRGEVVLHMYARNARMPAIGPPDLRLGQERSANIVSAFFWERPYGLA